MPTIPEIDKNILTFCDRAAVPFARFALFIIYFWFGLLKVVGESPASPLVKDLLARTLPFISPELFVILFGVFEMLIGLLFIVPGLERVAIPVLFFHMFLTAGPLVLLPQETWSSFLAPTLEGQYIIKNLALIGCAIGIVAKMEPIKRWF